MKVGTQSHPKFLRLCRRLGVPSYGVAGILELLWMLCVSGNRLDGSLEGYDDEDIAAYVGWDGKPDVLIEALVASGWLDRGEGGDLSVHDYEDHCPDYVKKRAKRRTTVTDGDRAADNGGRRSPRGTKIGVGPPSLKSQPNQTQPNQTKPKNIVGASAPTRSNASRSTRSKYTADFEQFWEAYPRRSAKGRAAKAFDQHLRFVGVERELVREDAVAFLVESATEYAGSLLVRSTPPDRLPHAATWLNDRRYEDDRTEWQRARDGPVAANGSKASEFKF